jgi:hypothetical protein
MRRLIEQNERFNCFSFYSGEYVVWRNVLMKIAGIFLISCGGVRLSPIDTSAINCPIVDDECGAVGGMRIGRGTEVL